MASWNRLARRALQPIPRVVDNTDLMAIKQFHLDRSHKPIRAADMPGGPGTFSPYGNTNFGMPGAPGH